MKKSELVTNMEEFTGLKNQHESIEFFKNYNSDKYGKYFIETWGCQMNEHDSERLAGILKNMRFKPVEKREDADLVIFNTCAVRENAELKVYGNLGHLKSLKRRKTDLKIVVCGCMMQQEYVVKELKEKYPFVDLIFGTHNTHMFPKMLEEVYKTNETYIEVWDEHQGIIEDMPASREYDSKAFVNIMYGCNNFCSYCIVPYTRGRERSRQPEAIIEEIQTLVGNGVKEVTLLGQNVNSYGNDFDHGNDFSDLLVKVNAIEGLKRIHFMSSHPKDFSKKLADTMAQLDKVCEFLHLPIQAAGNDLLKRMNRKYTREEYLEKVKYAIEKNDNLAISTDIIIGFPGETEEDINHLIDVLNEVKYDNVFSFKYSKRKGTPAYEMADQIDEKVKQERFERVLEVINKNVKEKNSKYKGKIVEVLVEGTSRKDDTVLMGKSRRFKTVNFNGSKDLIGELVKVKITKPKSFSLYGEFIEKVK